MGFGTRLGATDGDAVGLVVGLLLPGSIGLAEMVGYGVTVVDALVVGILDGTGVVGILVGCSDGHDDGVPV